jgi:hypothetical protein
VGHRPAAAWARRNGVRRTALPRHLGTAAWVDLHVVTRR